MDNLPTIEARLRVDIAVCLTADQHKKAQAAERKARKPQAVVEKAAKMRVMVDLPAHRKAWCEAGFFDDWKAYICKEFGVALRTLRSWLPKEAKANTFNIETMRQSFGSAASVQIDNEPEGSIVGVMERACQFLGDHPEELSLSGQALQEKYPEIASHQTFAAAKQYWRGVTDERARREAEIQQLQKRIRRLAVTEAPEGFVMLDNQSVRVLRAAVHVDKDRPLDAQYAKMAQASEILANA